MYVRYEENNYTLAYQVMTITTEFKKVSKYVKYTLGGQKNSVTTNDLFYLCVALEFPKLVTALF